LASDNVHAIPGPPDWFLRDRPELSVVVPVFEEGELVPVLVERLSLVLDAMGVSAQVILVDDGSRDETFAAIEQAHEADPRFVGIGLSRNFGHQVAISAGLAEASGDAVLVMDGDLQDPPEAIPALWAKFLEGFDVVYAIRASRPEGWLKRLAYAGFYRLLEKMVAIPIPRDAGDFGLISRRVVDLIVAMPERRRYVRGLRAWAGFRQVGVPIPRGSRYAGRPKFTIGKLLGLAIDGLVGFSEGLLRPVGFLGFAAVLMALIGGMLGGVRAILGLGMLPIWGWIGLVVVFFGGAQLLSVAIVGEYVGRILIEVNGRPLYIARHRVGLPPANEVLPVPTAGARNPRPNLHNAPRAVPHR
jgi:glycosyltransferase involved in cell wall biosynthesis